MTNLQAFHDQVKRGGLEGVRSSLAEDPSLLDAKNDAGQTALLLAKYYRQEEIARYLQTLDPQMDVFLAAAVGQSSFVGSEIDRDATLLTAYSSDGWTVLHIAAFFGHDGLVSQLIDCGATIDMPSTNQMKNTPLHAAVAGRKVESVRVLLEREANPNVRQEGGWTPLHGAAQNGDRSIVELLLAHGADVKAQADNKQAALDLALMKGNGELAALFEELGAGQ